MENKKLNVLFFLAVMAVSYITFGIAGFAVASLVLFLRGDGKKEEK